MEYIMGIIAIAIIQGAIAEMVGSYKNQKGFILKCLSIVFLQ